MVRPESLEAPAHWFEETPSLCRVPRVGRGRGARRAHVQPLRHRRPLVSPRSANCGVSNYP